MITKTNIRILATWCTPVAIFGAFLITIFGAYSVTDYTPLDAEAKAVLGAENKRAREYQEYSFDSPPHRIRVFDVVGAERLCMENVPEGNRHELDISHLTPGVYVVHLEHRNGTVIRQLRVD